MCKFQRYILLKAIVIAATFLLFGQNASAFTSVMTGTLATPTVYEVTITKIEFKNTSETYVTFFSGSVPLDIASANPGGAVGAIGQSSTLPSGTYTEMRITFSRTFGIVGSVADAGSGQPARTATGNPANQTQGTVSNIGVATTDGATATKQSIPIPTGASVTTILTNNNMEEVAGNQIRFTVPSSFSFTISEENAVMPNLRMNFDVTNSIEFLTTGVGSAVVIPLPPDVSVTIG